jgi:hypothetical protein
MSTLDFEGSRYYTGPDLTDEMVGEAERVLGYRLPASYRELLHVRNGGVPTRTRFRTPFPTSWAPDHFEIAAIRGVGGPWGIESPGPLSSPALIEEWGYPRIGIVICDMPSGGHDAVMLDYRPAPSEPAVAYIDEDREPRVIAESFGDFISGLVPLDGS